MATASKSPAVHPLRYILGTLVYTLLSLLVIGVMTIVMYTVAENMGSPYPKFYTAAMLGMAIFLSQEIMFNQDVQEEANEASWLKTSIMALVSVGFYNLLMFASLVVINLAIQAQLGQWTYLVAFLYPAYDLKTGFKGNPLSVSGIIFWVTVVLYFVGWMSQALVSSVRDIELGPFRLIDELRYRRPG